MTKIFLLSFLLVFPSFRSQAFERVSGLPAREIRFLALSPSMKSTVYAASANRVYKRSPDGSWSEIFSIVEGDINAIYVDPAEYNLFFVASDQGLALTFDGRRFTHIFKAAGMRCLSVKRRDNLIYLGTDSGLYRAEFGLYNFGRVTGLPRELEVYQIDFVQDTMFLVTNRGVYRSKDTRHFEHTFTDVIPETAEDVRETEAVSAPDGTMPRILAADWQDSSRIYLGTEKGLFVSEDAGGRFRRQYLSGLPEGRINFILQSQDEPELLYFATSKGLYRVDPARGMAVKDYRGLPTNRIHHIVSDSEGGIYLATARGVFASGIENNRYTEVIPYSRISAAVPSVIEIQEAALRYNQVDPEKITRWRRALRFRGLMPVFRVDYYKTIQGGGTGTNFGNFAVGPQDWKYYLQWDFKDVLWNRYEDNIDTRARLNTRLRLDILSDVNRLYFERLKVQRELMKNEAEGVDRYTDKILYLKELTAELDAYTGGYFSARKAELQGTER